MPYTEVCSTYSDSLRIPFPHIQSETRICALQKLVQPRMYMHIHVKDDCLALLRGSFYNQEKLAVEITYLQDTRALQ